MPAGVLPAGGIARFYGEAAIHKDDPIAQRIWDRLVQPEKDRDPERKGSAVLVRVERSGDLRGRTPTHLQNGQPLGAPGGVAQWAGRDAETAGVGRREGVGVE